MDLLFQEELQDENLPEVQEKILISLWEGLTLFLHYPHVPMDNNPAERSIRGPVIARKNYFGSGSIWSGLLAATCFTLFQTLQLHNMEEFLPWNLTSQQKLQWAMDMPAQNSS